VVLRTPDPVSRNSTSTLIEMSHRLRPRDYTIAWFLHEHVTLTTDQLTAILFTNPITCRHRLNALRLVPFPPPAMLAQLDRLLGLTGMHHIKLGIIPFGVELATAPQNSFVLFDDQLAVVETFVGETMYHGEEAAAYAAAMEALAAEARYESEARKLVLQAIDELRPSS
jgi:hypothetical protein